MSSLKRRPLADLFIPVDPYSPKLILITTCGFSRLRELSLRYFHIPADLNSTYRWVEEEFSSLLLLSNKRQRFEDLKMTNELSLCSSESQVMVCLYDNKLVAQIDICPASMDNQFSKSFQSNSLSLRLSLAPEVKGEKDIFIGICHICLQYFCLFDGIDRIMIGSVGGLPHECWLLEAGFTKISKINNCEFTLGIFTHFFKQNHKTSRSF